MSHFDDSSPRSGRRQFLGTAATLAAGLYSDKGQAQPGESFAIVGGELLNPAVVGHKGPIKDAVIVVSEGKYSYVGDDPSRAAGMKTISAKGKLISAGLIDLLTHIGVVEVSLEKSTRDDSHGIDDPIRAAFRTADGYNPASSLVAIARIEGLTSVGVIPRGGLVTGQSAWVDLAGASRGEVMGRAELALHINLEGEQSLGTSVLRLRELFDDALLYSKNKGGFDARQMRGLSASRLDLQVVERAQSGDLSVVVRVDRAADILTTIELAKDNKLRLVLASVAEGWKVAGAIADAEVPCIIYGLDHGPRSFHALGAREDNAALLNKKGVTIALSTGETHNARKLRQVAGNCVRAGLPAAVALDAISDTPARIFGMDDYGAAKVGRLANLAIWSADPLELSSRATIVFIRGKKTSLRSRQTALFERYHKPIR